MIKVILLTLLVWTNAIWANDEIKNVIKFQPSGTLVQGDSVKISAQLWPIENYDESKFVEFKNKVFLEHFYVNDIRATRSENNYDVILLEVDAIAESPAPMGKQVNLAFGEYSTSTSLPFEIEKLEEFDGQFVILNQAVDYVGKNLGIALAILAAILIILIFVNYRKKIFNYLGNNQKEAQRKAHFQTLFHNAKERSHFEEIYARKNEWLVYIPEKNQVLHSFFKTIEEHQYKKNWTKEELFEVKDSFDKIRGGIK